MMATIGSTLTTWNGSAELCKYHVETFLAGSRQTTPGWKNKQQIKQCRHCVMMSWWTQCLWLQRSRATSLNMARTVFKQNNNIEYNTARKYEDIKAIDLDIVLKAMRTFYAASFQQEWCPAGAQESRFALRFVWCSGVSIGECWQFVLID